MMETTLDFKFLNWWEFYLKAELLYLWVIKRRLGILRDHPRGSWDYYYYHFFIMLAPPERCIFSLLFYQSNSINILYSWHSYSLGPSSSKLSFPFSPTLPSLTYTSTYLIFLFSASLCFPFFRLTSFSALSLWPIQKKRRMSEIWTTDLPVALRVLYPLDHGDPRFSILLRVLYWRPMQI